MGCCCSRCCGDSDGDNRRSSTSETEMRTRLSGGEGGGGGKKAFSISRAMSAPSVEIKQDDRLSVSGYGLALVSVSIEQDAAYWEAHIDLNAPLSSSSSSHGDSSSPTSKRDGGEQRPSIDVWFGVATRKDRKFYNALEEADVEEESPERIGTSLMRKISVRDGDVVGIAIQQSDLPMIQFLLNGEPMHDEAINRFRGLVYPSLCIPPGTDDALLRGVKLVFEEDRFKFLSPHARFGPLIIARGLL